MTEEIKTKIEKFLAELNTEVDILSYIDVGDIDLENTIKIIDKCLALPPNYDFYYSSSW